LTVEKEATDQIDWGFTWKEEGKNLFVSKVMTDSPAYQAGLNEGDEILASHGLRLMSSNYKKWIEVQKSDTFVELLISRKGRLLNFEIMPVKPKVVIKILKVKDQALLTKALDLC
jgi:predicted metalloprotease with PDZ domain